MLRVVALRPADCRRPFGAFWWGRWPVTGGSRPRLYAIAPSGLGEEGRHSREGAPFIMITRRIMENRPQFSENSVRFMVSQQSKAVG